MYPMCALRHPASWLSLNRARFVPSTSTSPSVQRSIPARRFSKVDFPEPLGPISARKSPFSISRLTRLSAMTSKPSRAKRLLTLRTWTIVSDMLRFLVLACGTRILRMDFTGETPVPLYLIGNLHSIPIAQLVRSGYRCRLATAEAFDDVVEVARGFAHPYNSLL